MSTVADWRQIAHRLSRYAQHLPRCGAAEGRRYSCTCGVADAVKRLRQVEASARTPEGQVARARELAAVRKARHLAYLAVQREEEQRVRAAEAVGDDYAAGILREFGTIRRLVRA